MKALTGTFNKEKGLVCAFLKSCEYECIPRCQNCLTVLGGGTKPSCSSSHCRQVAPGRGGLAWDTPGATQGGPPHGRPPPATPLHQNKTDHSHHQHLASVSVTSPHISHTALVMPTTKLSSPLLRSYHGINDKTCLKSCIKTL